MGRRAREGRACGRRRCAFRTQRRTRRPSCGTRRRRAAGRQGDWFAASDDGFAAADGEGNEVHVDSSGVVINGEHFDSWQDAHARYGYGHLHEERWNEPCGYTVCGERFDTLEQARAKYGDGVGTTIPVRKHYLRAFEKSWVKFPYPLVVILAYLLLGIFDGAWGMGLFLFFTIPLYYMAGARHRPQTPCAVRVGRVPHLRDGVVLLHGVRPEPAASGMGGVSDHPPGGVARVVALALVARPQAPPGVGGKRAHRGGGPGRKASAGSAPSAVSACVPPA